MRRRHSLFSFSLDEGINLTPLLDIIFNLVFFFLLATTLRQHEAALNVDLPEAGETAQTQPQDADTIIVNVTRANVIIVNNRVMSPEELADHLRERAEAKPGLSLIVRGDSESNYQTMVRVMEAGSAAGITNLVFQVEKPRGR